MHNLITKALKVMESEFIKGGDKYSSSLLVRDYIRLQLGAEKEEVFAILFMNTQLELLSFDKLFRGSISESTVPPRAIARRVFELNAATMILCHNHPSGSVIPSRSDLEMTTKLKELFKQLDCQIIDHVIVSAIGSYSMAENGDL